MLGTIERSSSYLLTLNHSYSRSTELAKNLMSEEQLNVFLEKVETDSSLQEKLGGVSNADTVVVIAKEAGFVISANEIKTAQ